MKSIGDMMSPWITPLPILNVPENICSPSMPLTLADPVAAEYIALNMALLFLDAPALASVMSRN